MKKNFLNTKYLVLVFALMLLPFLGFSFTTYDKTTKYPGSQSAWAFVFMDDGGYVATGFTKSAAVADTNVLVIRYNLRGDTLWTRSIGGAGVDWGYYIVRTSDGNLAIAGSTNSSGAGSDDFFLIKMDISGNVMWKRTYGTPVSDIARSLCETKDGGFCLAGYTMTTPTNEDAYLVKTNSDGTVIQFAKTFGGAGDDHFYGIRQLPDENYILTGGTTTGGLTHGDMDLYLVKVGKLGNVIWQKAFGGANFDEGKYIILAPDGNYVMAGQTAPLPGNDDAYILKTDTSGSPLWSKSYGAENKDLARSIENTSDGGFVIGAITRSYGHSTPQMWLIKVDNVGAFKWQNIFGGSLHQHCYQAKPTAEGGYQLVGHSDSFSGGANLNVYLVRTDGLGQIVGISEQFLKESTLSIFPNPAVSHINVQFNASKSAFCTFRILNIVGAELYKETELISEGNVSKTISLASLNGATGVYFIQIQSEGFVKSEKIIIR